MESFKDMNDHERELLSKVEEGYKKRHYCTSEDIKYVLVRSLGFKKPQLFNVDCIMSLDREQDSDESLDQNSE